MGPAPSTSEARRPSSGAGQGFVAFVTALVVDVLVVLVCGPQLVLGNLTLAGARFDDAELRERYQHNIVVLAIAAALFTAIAAVLFATRHKASGVAQLAPVLIAAIMLIGVIAEGPGTGAPPRKPEPTAVPAADCAGPVSPAGARCPREG